MTPRTGGSARRKAVTYTEQHKHGRNADKHPMPRMGLEPTIPAFERPMTFSALDRAATGLLSCKRKVAIVINQRNKDIPSHELRFGYPAESGVHFFAGTLPRTPDHRLYRIEHAVFTGWHSLTASDLFLRKKTNDSSSFRIFLNYANSSIYLHLWICFLPLCFTYRRFIVSSCRITNHNKKFYFFKKTYEITFLSVCLSFCVSPTIFVRRLVISPCCLCLIPP
jgi:hypothetical protein